MWSKLKLFHRYVVMTSCLLSFKMRLKKRKKVLKKLSQKIFSVSPCDVDSPQASGHRVYVTLKLCAYKSKKLTRKYRFSTFFGSLMKHWIDRGNGIQMIMFEY